MTALDQLLVYAKTRGLDVKWRRGKGVGFWEAWCDGAPLCSDWTPSLLMERLTTGRLSDSARRQAYS